jgi:hypothetical protein
MAAMAAAYKNIFLRVNIFIYDSNIKAFQVSQNIANGTAINMKGCFAEKHL